MKIDLVKCGNKIKSPTPIERKNSDVHAKKTNYLSYQLLIINRKIAEYKRGLRTYADVMSRATGLPFEDFLT